MSKVVWRGVASVMVVALVACGGGTTVTGPDNVPTSGTIEPTSGTAAAPQPVADPGTPAPGSAFKLYGKAGVLYLDYSGAARTKVETYYTSFDDQSTKFAVQVDNIEPNSTFSREIGACRQGDAEQVGVKPIGGIFFDKDGNPFNPTKNPEKTVECRNQCVPTWGEWGDEIGEQTVRACTKRQVRVQTCTGEKEYRTVDAPRPAAYTLGTLSYPAYTPKQAAVPATQYYYNYTNSGQNPAGLFSGGGGRWTCEFYGGSWIGNLQGVGQHVCTFSTYKGVTVGTYTIGTYHSNNGQAAVDESGGNPISGSAQIANAGTFKLVLKATDPGNYDKDVDTKTLVCGQSATLSVDYNWINHSSDDWFLQLYLNNVLVATSPVVNNPSN